MTPSRFNQSKPNRPKVVDVPRRPDTPDSTQEVQGQDTSTMEADPSEHPEDDDIAAQALLEPESQSPTTPDASNRKPSMRIDTQTDIGSFFKPVAGSGVVESPAPMTVASATPRRPPPPTPPAQDSSKRATRISSGVLLKKSVSEILGETPKATPFADSPDVGDARESSLEAQSRLLDRERRDRDRSKLSTVVFAKPQKQLLDAEMVETLRPDLRDNPQRSPSERDYLYTLFENKAYSMTRQGAMTYLIQNAHKTLSTADHLVDYQMQTECRILETHISTSGKAEVGSEAVQESR